MEVSEPKTPAPTTEILHWAGLMKRGKVILACLLACYVLVLVTRWRPFSLYLHPTQPALVAHHYGDTQNGNQSKGWIIYECDGSMLCGGWADRQKGIVAAYLLAQMTHRQLGVSITFPCPLELKLQPNKVDWRVPDLVWQHDTHQTIRMVDSKARNYGKYLAWLDLDADFTEPVIRLTSNMEWTQFLRQNKRFASRSPLLCNQSIPISAVYRRSLRDLFTLTEPLQTRLNTFKEKIGNRKLACAHVRLGKGIPGETKHVTDVGEAGLQKLWDFLQLYADQGYAIFVPSDTRLVSVRAKQIFPNNIVDFPGKVVHVDKAKGSAACEGMDKVLLDQEALSLCEVIVVSRSGLGLIGSWLRPREDNTFCLVNFSVIPCPRDDYDTIFAIDDW